MFMQATDLRQAPLPQVDLCIIGAGPAGLTMAGRLADSGLRIALLESGQRNGALDKATEAMNTGTSSLSDYPFQYSRVRGFGGTSLRWTGACVQLDPDDFEVRDWVPHSGWPITADDLIPYYAEAAPIYGLVDDTPYLPIVRDTPLHGDGLEARFAQLTKTTNLSHQFEPIIDRSNSITCLLGATATGFDTSPNGSQITGVELHDSAGDVHHIKARATVLATGGIEAPRLMLRAKPAQKSAMGPAANIIGRYHMEHPIRSMGVIKVPDAQRHMLGFTNFTSTNNADLQGVFGLDLQTRTRHRLLNMHFRAYRFHPLENDPSIIRLKEIAGGAGLSMGKVFSEMAPKTIAKWARYGVWHLWNQRARSARFDHLRLLAFLEQEPDPDNRVTLSNETDPFGQPLPHLKLTTSALMKDSVARSLEVIETQLRARGLSDFDLSEPQHLAHYGSYGYHHMGATRMSATSTQGVVDANCKVHGLENLFIASSSVFPTGGAANPTLTISALALRLSLHLTQTLFRN